ncbi:MAG: N-acetylmuramidase family protein [Sphingomonadales bacterium]|nr:N-acetylmuramidase family protein [Sphingomonadales bacterium]
MAPPIRVQDLQGSVGAAPKAANAAADVKLVQRLFNRLDGRKASTEDGTIEPDLVARIRRYQTEVMHFTTADGRIDPGGKTIARLCQDALAALSLPPAAPGAKLWPQDFAEAAARLGPGIEPALVRAFAEVESGGKSGFGPAGLPIIAYEGHRFRKYTGKIYDQSHPKLSYPYVKKAGPEWQVNNANQQVAWTTLAAAAALDWDAALMACSWGMFQVMGDNFTTCGYPDVDGYVYDMKRGERGQLDAFVGFCKGTSGLVAAMRAKAYDRMATLYNGPDFGDYDKRIKRAYERYSTG